MNELEQLLRISPDIWRGDGYMAGAGPVRSSGHAGLDRLLPGGGWPYGVISVRYPGHGIGELRLFLPLIAAVSRQEHRVVFLRAPYIPYAPAMQGVNPDRLYWSKIAGFNDGLWAADRLLRNPVCGLVLLWCCSIDVVSPARLRRLQLAARQNRSHLLLFMPGEKTMNNTGGWESLALHLYPLDNRLRVRVDKARSLSMPVQTDLDMDQ